jgi:hypothetical protein
MMVMIIKERLEELIKEEKTIYFIDFWGNICPIMLDKDFLIKNLVEFGLGENELTRIDDECSYDARDLFETVQDAKFQLNFKHIKAPDRFLDLPEYDDLLKHKNEVIKIFYKEQFRYRLIEFNDTIRIWKINLEEDTNEDKLFWKITTKENYTKACEIAKKLYLGEKV